MKHWFLGAVVALFLAVLAFLFVHGEEFFEEYFSPYFSEAHGSLPADAADLCPVERATLKGWFAIGRIERDGVTTPAPSDTFRVAADSCDFFKWGERMMLWLLSPQNGAPILASPVFYNVSPLKNGSRRMLPGSQIPLLSLRREKIEENNQAGGGGVLMSRAESLVYYGIHVNDIFAEFLTAQKTGVIEASAFPTGRRQIDELEEHLGRVFSDADALTMEVKTAWVEAESVDRSRFVTIWADVPVYRRGPEGRIWTPEGTDRRELALVGLHIAGSARHQPGMIWATFEHIDNAPMDDFHYLDTDEHVRTQSYNSGGQWTFMTPNATREGANIERMRLDNAGRIIATLGNTIGPSNTYLENPWGARAAPLGRAGWTSRLISLNRTVRQRLKDGDIRRQYIQTGATWFGIGNRTAGARRLANSTMETYKQDLNCLVCHSGAPFKSNGLSHIYSEIEPLRRIETGTELTK